jgi:hypothetical protein
VVDDEYSLALQIHHEESKVTLDATLFMVDGKLTWIFESTSLVSILVNSNGLIQTCPISTNLLIWKLFWT